MATESTESIEKLVQGLRDIKEKSVAFDNLKSSTSEMSDVFELAESVFPVLATAKILILIGEYLALTPNDLAILQSMKK